MSSVPIQTYSGLRLDPKYPGQCKQKPYPLAPGTYPAGSVMGQITAANVNDVQTITVTSSTGGTFKVTVPFNNQSLSVTVAYNVSLADLQTALNNLLNVNPPLSPFAASGATQPVRLAVTGTPGASYVITAALALAGRPLPAMTVTDNTTGSGHSVTIAHTTPGVGPFGALGAYVDANTDGTGVAVGLLEYACYVDLFGNITIGSSVTQSGGEWGQTLLSAPAFYQGDFDLADLTGLDADALTDLNAHVIAGSVASGIGVLHIG